VHEEENAVANTRAAAAVLLVGILGTARLDATPAGPVTEPDATIKAAVALLPEAVRSTLPEIVLVAEPESGGPQWQAYVEQGSTRIYVNTNGQGYLGAAGGNKDALKFLASVIAHEHAHARHGASEAEAYAVQIATLKTLKVPKDIVRAVEEAAAHFNR
jgi:hypothetical protein